MTFNEANIRRDKNGKFERKEGSAPSVVLPSLGERKRKRRDLQEEAEDAMRWSGYDPNDPSADPIAADRYFSAEYRALEASLEPDEDSKPKQAAVYTSPFLEVLDLLPSMPPIVGLAKSAVRSVRYKNGQKKRRRMNELRAMAGQHPEYRELDLMVNSTPEGRLEMLDARVSEWVRQNGRPDPASFEAFARSSWVREPKSSAEQKGFGLARKTVLTARYAYLNDDPEQYEVPFGMWEMKSGYWK